MSTLLYQHDAFIDHVVPDGHPERPDRMRATRKALSDVAFDGLQRREHPLAEADVCELAHPKEYIAAILDAAPKTGLQGLDPDTWMSPNSVEAALRAVGGSNAAVDAVLAGDAVNAFCDHRPPGHHAEKTKAMGFCLFSTAAIAARHAVRNHGLERVAVVDFDVHHGNGTQDVVEDDPTIFYASTHEGGIFPGTGRASETGVGNIANVPLGHHSGGTEFRAAYERVILPALDDFAPDLIIVSAGFDAHRDDPLASLQLDVEDFVWITEKLCEAAATHCDRRLVSLLEGGYDLAALGASTAAHVSTLMTAAKG
jgi:acetoin utilization deacetylase AcuC-like enzyme